MSTEKTLAKVTDQIIETIETGNHGSWIKPWTTTITGSGLGVNAATGKAYQGMNQLVLLVTTAAEGYSRNVWATYKQYQALGGQVRKGETGTPLVKWGKTYRCATCGAKGPISCKVPAHDVTVSVWASAFTVFNIDQQDGFHIVDELPTTEAERLEAVEAFIAKTGATINHRAQDQAYYSRTTDEITVPLREQFSTTEGYYGTVLHELTHWAGADHRLGRPKGAVFGDSVYAAEELVAELGATFIAARFGITIEPTQESIAYLAGWLRSLKADARALYRTAKAAQDALEYLLDLAQVEEVEVAS